VKVGFDLEDIEKEMNKERTKGRDARTDYDN